MGSCLVFMLLAWQRHRWRVEGTLSVYFFGGVTFVLLLIFQVGIATGWYYSFRSWSYVMLGVNAIPIMWMVYHNHNAVPSQLAKWAQEGQDMNECRLTHVRPELLGPIYAASLAVLLIYAISGYFLEIKYQITDDILSAAVNTTTTAVANATAAALAGNITGNTTTTTTTTGTATDARLLPLGSMGFLVVLDFLIWLVQAGTP